MNEIDREEDIKLGEMVASKASKSRGPVVAVRLSPDLLARLTEYAQARGLTVSEVVRRGAEQILFGAVASGPVYYSGSELHGPGLVHGSPATGSARSLQRGLEGESDTPVTVPG